MLRRSARKVEALSRIAEAAAAETAVLQPFYETVPESVPKRQRRDYITAIEELKVEVSPSASVSLSPSPSVSVSPSVSPKKTPTKIYASLEPTAAPKRWKEIYDLITQMRKERNAPVDTMGCERLADPHSSPKDQRFHTLVSLMLSSQTKDEVTSAAMRRLHAHGLSVESVRRTPEAKIRDLIYGVGFHNRKAIYIKQTAEILASQYNGDIPETVEDLVKLPGVGPKMAYLCVQAAWHRSVGIGVDVHVHRISNRLGWVKTANKQPEDTRVALESWLPREHWSQINLLLVGFGQTICTPINPKCDRCSANKLCPSAFRDTNAKRMLDDVIAYGRVYPSLNYKSRATVHPMQIFHNIF